MEERSAARVEAEEPGGTMDDQRHTEQPGVFRSRENSSAAS